ncbi:Holliday junction branch migration protein RuvA [Gottschalkiaceae bacterium SANA]|nr:Holliday junction branch migration protein RuvA [Gottschalkiaceae bacterium SANA]
MLDYIIGRVEEIQEGALIIDRDGLGILVHSAGSSLHLLQTGEEAKLYTELQIRDDQIHLVGFLSREERTMYRLLLSVSKVGPKAAMGLMTGLALDTLQGAILAEDDKALSSCPGIGKKTAERIIFDLRGKIEGWVPTGNAQTSMEIPAITEATEGLMALGYSRTEALHALNSIEKMTEESTASQLIRAALRNLVR